MAARAAAALAALAALLTAADAQSTARLCARATCFAEGAAECDRASASCPPCMYEITGGGISCYSKEGGACPFPDPLVDCPAKTTPTPTVKASPSPSPTAKPTLTPSPSPSPKVSTVTEQPATVTPPLIDTPTATTSQGSHPNSIQNDPKTTSSMDTRAVTQSPSSSSASSTTSSTSDTTKATTTTAPVSAPVNTLESSDGLSSGSGKPSSAFLNIGVIIAAVAGTAIVALFVTRRMKQRREMRFLETPDDSNKQFNLQVDGRTTPVSRRGDDGAAASASSGAGIHPPGIGTAAAPVMTKAAMAVGTRVARANSNTSEAPSLLSMASLGSSTGEFHHPQYYQAPQYGAPPSYGAPPAYGVASEASSFRTSSNVSASSAAFVYSSNGLSRPQLAPDAEDPAVLSKRKQSSAATPGRASARQPHQPVYQPPVRRKSSAISLTSGNIYEDEYDIVRPGALQDAEHRNTETLMEDGRFQSNFSDSDVRALQGERHFFDSREHEI